jgi:uncharacterized protein YggE
MNGNVTISLRSILLVAVVLLAVVVAYLLGGSGGTGAPAAQAADGSRAGSGERRLLTTTGTGHASAVPDELSFGLAVAVTRPELDAALDAANRTMTRVLGSLEEHDVARSDVETTGLSMNPVYDYHQYAPPTIRGYRVAERATVLVEELRDGGAAVSSAVAAGGNSVRVGDIRLLVGDTDAVLAKARDAAVAEATAKADQYAEASGQDLGDVVTLREVRSRPLATPTTQYDAIGRAADMAPSSVPVRAGRDRTSVTVEVVWELA